MREPKGSALSSRNTQVLLALAGSIVFEFALPIRSALACGATPRAPICNLPRCTPDGWVFYPIPAGSACNPSAGQQGLCDGGKPPPPGQLEPDALGQCIATLDGQLFPKYKILNVMYAPPGSQSTVDYGAGSQLGSTTNSQSTWNNSTTVTVSNSSSLFGFAAGGLTISAGKSFGGTSQTSLDFKQTTSTDFILDGFHDIINHDLDRIYLWLNPEVDVSINGNNLSWAYATKGGGLPLLAYVNPVWLRDPTQMPSDVAATLRSAGITSSEYPTILAADPFAAGLAAIDTNRFVLQTLIPYEPVAVQGQNPTATVYTISKVTTNGSTSTTTSGYNVGMTVTGSVGFLDAVSLKLAVQDQFTYTDTDSFAKSAQSSIAARASVVQPAYGYTGPITLAVYVDTLYNTFMFALE